MSSGQLILNNSQQENSENSKNKKNSNEENDSERDLKLGVNLETKEAGKQISTQHNLVSEMKERRPTLQKKISISNSKITSSTNSKTKKRPQWQKSLSHFLDSTPVLIIMSLCTLFALFASDIKAAWLRIEVDEAFNIIQCILLGLFGIEFILNCIAKKDYSLSFFFWLDLISTISIIQDIDYIMNPILGYGPDKATSKKSTQAASKAISKVSSATRATRVLRVVRIVRLIRMVKLYKSIYIAREKAEKEKKNKDMKSMLKNEKEISDLSSTISKCDSSRDLKFGVLTKTSSSTNVRDKKNETSSEGNQDGQNGMLLHDPSSTPASHNNRRKSSINMHFLAKADVLIGDSHKENELKPKVEVKEEKKYEIKKEESINFAQNNLEDDEEELIKESRISKIVTESITKKVIVLILVLLIVFPFLSDDFYTSDTSVTYSMLAEYLANDYHLYSVYSYIIPLEQLEIFFDEKFPCLNITVGNSLYFKTPNYTTTYFRYKEVSTVYSEDGIVKIVYSILKETKLSGLLSFIQTLFVCLMLTGAAILFENDASKLVLEPLEVMIEIVENVAKDPINAKNVENLQTGIKQMIEKTEEEKAAEKVAEKKKDNYEVTVIKSAIIKISALLAIGFGEAGGEIIQKNLANSQELNPRLKGKKKTAIFGFCDIRQFEEINLALEERTMLFVNEIAEIVHSSVDRFGGATNKNIGEAFLNVWKFYNETPVRGAGTHKKVQRKDNLLEIDPTNPQVGITADESVLAFLRIIMKINKSYNILNYRNNPEILKRIPNFKLNMGFGLHMGYGIEGAVGSTYKIDASYLSPNVNIAARLESATRQFGLSLLISGPLYKLLTEEMKHVCRFVDCVMVKGSELPLDLYTIDVNLDLKPQDQKKILIMSNKDKRKRFADKKELFQKEVEFTRSATKIVLEKSSYIELLRTKKTDEFYAIWKEGVNNYKEGNFSKAGEYFKKCLTIDPEDGPSKTLLGYFSRRNYKAPEGWNGVRELTSK